MIKRMTKVTSLLVAAAAIVSLVPANGVNAAERLGTKEGTIDSAIAFDGGKYLFRGYKTEEDDQAIYFNDGSKDKLLEDLEDADIVGVYGNKYAVVNDGDEYLVDLSTGKVIDDETTEDKMDNVKSKLKSTLGKTDRYGKVISTDKVTLAEVSKNQFGDIWYSYTTTGAAGTFSGYVNESGKYIDTDYIANIYVFNGTKMVKAEKFGKENDNVKVDLLDSETIAQDKDNLYRKVKVNITTKDGVTVGDYVQKISKAQGDKEDDAYLPKTVTSYEISAAYDSDDADDAVKIIEKATEENTRVIKGNLYITDADSKNVTVTVLKLKKDKVKLDDTAVSNSKLDVYLVEKDTEDESY